MDSLFTWQLAPGFAEDTSRFAGKPAGFTLIEMMLASIAAALILVAIYGLFHRAIKMRDSATERIRESRLRARAVNVIGNDLRNAFISGGILAASLEGGSQAGGNDGSGGYLRFTTTTGKDTPDETYGDVEMVEYYIEKDGTDAASPNAGALVRVVTRDLLDTVPNVTHEERILSGVSSFQVSFYDGANWQGNWVVGGTNSTTTAETASTSGTTPALPDAIRIDIQQAASAGRDQPPPPLEIVEPWTAIPFLSGTNFTSGASSSISQ